MKSNVTTYILILIVLSLWGVLIYKFVDDLSDDVVVPASVIKSDFKIPKNTKRESFELLPVEKDPFLGTSYIPSKTAGNVKKKEPINWPMVSYLGLVSSVNQKAKIFVVQINGSQHLLKKGDTIEKIRVLNGDNKSISLRYQGQIKEIPIE